MMIKSQISIYISDKNNINDLYATIICKVFFVQTFLLTQFHEHVKKVTKMYLPHTIVERNKENV